MVARLNQQRIDEFKSIYRRHYGVELDNAEAQEKATAVVEMFRAVYRAIPADSPFIPKKKRL